MSAHQMGEMTRWTHQSRMSNPGDYAAELRGLPIDVADLNRIIQGVLIHADWLPTYGLPAGAGSESSRETLPIADRLRQILKMDSQPLDFRRQPADRSFATCRDFALLLCSLLRNRNVPARLRCGFAAYLNKGWEDHWLCEYWDSRIDDWLLADPQIDDVLKAHLNARFDPAIVPYELFLPAGKAWLECRAGRLDPDNFGHGGTKGLWFIHVNVLRDHIALNNREVSPWDTWRAAIGSRQTVTDAERVSIDALAAHPEQPIVEVAPRWLS
jgi:hypothetical protein